jgi:hypothetical protein
MIIKINLDYPIVNRQIKNKQMRENRIIILIAICLIMIEKSFSISIDSLKHIDFEGTIRAKFEYKNISQTNRFQIRNARFSFNGNLNRITSYKAELDLSDEGVTKMLDAYVKMDISKNINMILGQQKIPFSTDNLRSPHQLYFANRSFIGKQLTSLRDVGLTLKFKFSDQLPLFVLFGAYNGNGLYNQKQWLKFNEMDYTARLEFNAKDDVGFSLNFNTFSHFLNRMNSYNVGFMYQFNKLHVESEFFYKTYSLTKYEPTEGMFLFFAYSYFLKPTRIIKVVTPVIRYDYMTKNVRYSDSNEIIDLPNSRITVGLTLSLDKAFINDIRLNYEYYLPAKDGMANEESKFVIEIVSRF